MMVKKLSTLAIIKEGIMEDVNLVNKDNFIDSEIYTPPRYFLTIF